MQEIEKIYLAILSNDITTFFSGIICVVFLFAIVNRLIPQLKIRLLGELDRIGPSILTILGVLGTFVGILIGLLDFDVESLENSVPQLLDGLKIAFTTSVVGILFSILLRLFQALKPVPENRNKLEITPTEIYETLNSMEKSIKETSEHELQALVDLRNSISADNDSSLHSQVKMLRTDIKDGQNELTKAFQEFAKNIANDNTDALIEALEKVMRDFNTKINEQFGENFKQLNEAVGALLTWQENYKEHVEIVENKIQTTIEAIETSERALSDIVKHVERLPDFLSALELILEKSGEESEKLMSLLESTASLRDKALQAFPIIEENLEKLTSNLTQILDEITLEFKSGIEIQNQSLDALRRSQERILEESEKVSQNTVENLNKNFQNFDTQMEREINKCIELMGKNMASISEKFIEDYRTIISQLTEINKQIQKFQQ